MGGLWVWVRVGGGWWVIAFIDLAPVDGVVFVVVGWLVRKLKGTVWTRAA